MKLKERIREFWRDLKETYLYGLAFWVVIHIVVAIVSFVVVLLVNGIDDDQLLTNVLIITLTSFVASGVAALVMTWIPHRMSWLGNFLLGYLIVGCLAGIAVAVIASGFGIFTTGVFWPLIAYQYPGVCIVIAFFGGLAIAFSETKAFY